ncbi:hypothetical protein FQY42_19270 [Salmonella enterica]|nr:hypothetical protein [Salmonella enterica subsp. enterica serovar Montevideo]
MSYRLASPTKSNPAKYRIIQCPPGFFRTSSESIQRFNDLGNKSVRTPGRKISEKAGKFNFL